MKKILKVSGIVVGLLLLVGVCTWLSLRTSNKWNAQTIGDIPVPGGYVRDNVKAGSEAAFLRSLPLKAKGTKVKLYSGKNAPWQLLSTAVVDLPMLSNDEQCADMTMRLRAEWLFNQERYGDIKFQNVNGELLRYQGASRESLNKFLRRAYGVCNTFSVYHETEPRQIKDVRAGDVFVYPAGQRGKLGHAIIVVDVAHKGDKIALLLAEGNTPARECHILLNPNPLHNPWFFFDGDESTFWLSAYRFSKDELRHY